MTRRLGCRPVCISVCVCVWERWRDSSTRCMAYRMYVPVFLAEKCGHYLCPEWRHHCRWPAIKHRISGDEIMYIFILTPSAGDGRFLFVPPLMAVRAASAASFALLSRIFWASSCCNCGTKKTQCHVTLSHSPHTSGAHIQVYVEAILIHNNLTHIHLTYSYM